MKNTTTETAKNEIRAEFYNNLSCIEILEYLNNENSQNVKTIIESTEEMIKKYSRSMSYTQLRNIHLELKRANSESKLLKLQPKLAYFQARQEKSDAKVLIAFIREMSKKVTDDKISVFHDFLDALVAYHKLFGKN